MSETDMSTARTATLIACATAERGVYPQWVTNRAVDALAARGIRYVWDGRDWMFRHILRDGSYGRAA